MKLGKLLIKTLRGEEIGWFKKEREEGSFLKTHTRKFYFEHSTKIVTDAVSAATQLGSASVFR